MKRLELLSQCIKKPPNYIDSSFDYLNLSSFLTKEQNEVRLHIRKFVQCQINPTITPYIEESKFPDHLLPKLKELNILSYFFKPPYGKGFRSAALGTYVAELARGDAGCATMVLVQVGLLGYTIQRLGSQEQKQKYIPSIMSFDMVGGWGLTEDKIGSDASNLETSVTKTADGYRINGTKRWIGNGNRDLLIIWARNTDNKQVEGFILENKNSPGLTSTVIKHKLPLRVVQNCHITLSNVHVKQDQKLPKATNFNKGTNVVLQHSRLYVCWMAAGIALGIYDNAIKYISERWQFGRPISGFQLVQERIVRILSTTQAIMLYCFRVSQLVDENKATMGQIATCKAWVTLQLRDIARLGREICGGNGITHDNYVMKALVDAEAIYTYEGTYDINVLLGGREITGVGAFKK